jgi:antitoxin (DNA-binding transcriptional repressor) of toxin-antitoxin stability system
VIVRAEAGTTNEDGLLRRIWQSPGRLPVGVAVGLSVDQPRAHVQLTRAWIRSMKKLTFSLKNSSMGINSDDIVPMNQVRASFTELAEQVRSGKEKIITRNGESYVALVDARRLDHYHRLEREHIHLTLIDEATRGMADIGAGRTMSVAEVRRKYKTASKRRR